MSEVEWDMILHQFNNMPQENFLPVVNFGLPWDFFFQISSFTRLQPQQLAGCAASSYDYSHGSWRDVLLLLTTTATVVGVMCCCFL
jgi:hypothetical protein